MIAPNPKLLCNQAESYYYDFLRKETIKLIPESIVSHINHCATCQEQINQLRAVLIKSEEHLESDQREVSSAVTEMLKLHFAYIGKPVTCDIVKPFLPGLLDTALEIRIPTPITTHLDKCRQCSEDLEAIRKLSLSRKQLRRLSQLFAEKPAGSNINCTEAQSAIPSVVSIVFNETNAIILKHLCICPDCRGLLYQRREMALRGLPKTNIAKGRSLCNKISARDFFDYVVPYGIDPANDQYAKFRESLTSHLRTCPMCLAKMQQLHDTVFAIVERPESEVVTVYHIDESAKAKAVCETEELYAGFPIRVEAMEQKDEVKDEQPAPAFNIASALKQKVSTINRKLTVKTIATVAAVILIGFALLLNITSAKAVTIDQICKAIEKVKNVHITSFVPSRKEPIQELWVSRTANTYLLKTEKELVLWDIDDALRKSKQVATGVTDTTPLSTEMTAEVRDRIGGFLGLVPFADLSIVPKDADWSPVAGESLEATGDIEAHDLTWTEKAYDGSEVFRKWRVFVDPETDLPQRTEWYEKPTVDGEYILRSIKVAEYLNDNEMQLVIRGVF